MIVYRLIDGNIVLCFMSRSINFQSYQNVNIASEWEQNLATYGIIPRTGWIFFRTTPAETSVLWSHLNRRPDLSSLDKQGVTDVLL